MLNYINQDNFKQEVLEAKGVVVVDFFADWCAPCKMLSPILEELQSEMSEIKIVKINVDENNEISNEYGVQSIPTLKIFKDGNLVDTKVGFIPKDSLKETLEGIL